MNSFDPFWLPQFHTFPHHWTVLLAKHSPMTFTNALENLITVWNVKAVNGSPQKRYETEVTKLSQDNPFFCSDD